MINIDAENNTIIVGSKKYLEIKELKLRDLNLLGTRKELEDIVLIKVRSTGRLLKAKLNIEKKFATVKILEGKPAFLLAKHVFLFKDDRGDKLIGGGWIRKTYNANLSLN